MHVPQSVIDDSLRPASHILVPPLPAALQAELPPHSDCPPFILRKDEHALGVAFWAVPLLMRHASALFKALRRDAPQRSAALDESSADALLQCTRTLLLVNADNATAWNARKRRLVELGDERGSLTAPLLAELRLLSFLFSKHPKSSEAWAHRRWTAQRLLGATDSRAGAELELARGELAVVEMCAERYPKNYHAWLYRQWIVAAVDERQRRRRREAEAGAEDGGGAPRWMELLEGERRRIGAWNESHVSDHSGWHYRSFVVDRMLADASPAPPSPPAAPSQRATQLLGDELAYLSALQRSYPSHESAWSYRRYLLHAAVLRGGAEAERWREGEARWCDEREAARGQCASDDEWRLERRYARVHRLYVTELVATAKQRRAGVGDKERLTMDDVLRGMGPHDRARWQSDVASVQQVYPRQVWADRAALVT